MCKEALYNATSPEIQSKNTVININRLVFDTELVIQFVFFNLY